MSWSSLIVHWHTLYTWRLGRIDVESTRAPRAAAAEDPGGRVRGLVRTRFSTTSILVCRPTGMATVVEVYTFVVLLYLSPRHTYSSDTKYKLINTRRGRAYGSRARAEGIDMRSVVSKKESCLKSPFAQIFIRSNDSLGRPHCTVPPLRRELSL